MEREIVSYPHIQGVSFTDTDNPERFPPHWHDAAEFTVILKEGCRYKIGENSYLPAPGDILLIWPMELHTIVHVPKDASLFIQFSSRLIESNSDLVAAARFLNDCHLISAQKEPELAKAVKEKILKIGELFNSNPYFSETRCKLLIYEILLMIGEHVMQEQRDMLETLGNRHFSDRSWEYIRMACGYIAEHSAENITQAEVAKRTGLSPYYFSKLFNEYTKTSFPTYLASIRVQNAINLLANDKLSITDCAFAAGFQSTTSFNKLFHEFTGCSPRDYRKMHSLRG